MRLTRIIIPALAFLTLTACGGGGSRDSVSGMTGASVPVDTVASQMDLAQDIISRADSVVVSTIHVETTHPDLLEYRLQAQCSGDQCLILEPTTGFIQTVRASDVQPPAADAIEVETDHGITLTVEGSWTGDDLTSFGAWMEHSVFGVQTERAMEQGVSVSALSALSAGDLTGSRPAGSATWRGFMVGTPVTGDYRGDRLQGGAALNYDLSANALDVAFSGIKNTDTGAAHTTETVMFQDVSIAPAGTFESGLEGNQIQGGFYGPGHAEAAGVFEKANIVGAFGARR